MGEVGYKKFASIEGSLLVFRWWEFMRKGHIFILRTDWNELALEIEIYSALVYNCYFSQCIWSLPINLKTNRCTCFESDVDRRKNAELGFC